MASTANGSGWEEIAEAMQRHRADTIAAVEPTVPETPTELPLNVTGIPKELLSEGVLTITETPTERLVSQLATQKLTSTQVMKAFIQRAGLASKLVNCCTELLPERALERAKYLDDYIAEKKSPVGPLHGIPISVKEHIGMKGLDLNAGFVAWVGNIAPDDAIILKLLYKAGAVFYARTTEPQTLMHLETSNNIYGVTVNPYNTKLTPGGSSGGEGALLGMRGSCLGIGSDIGGSIRSPSANNGLFGLRPTAFRLPFAGWEGTMLGNESIIPVIGPLSTSLEGVKLFMKSILDQKPWIIDPSLVPMPWQTKSQLRQDANGKKKLRVGVLADDGIVRPHPPILRGINSIIEKLRSHSDIEVVDFPPYKSDEAWRIIASLYFGDGGSEEKEVLERSGEPWRPMSNFIIKENPYVKALTVPELWDLTIQREGYKAAYATHWNSVGTDFPGPDDYTSTFPGALLEGAEDKTVDVLLCPVGPGCAPPLDCARYWSYTAQWNLLDYPALVFPTGLQCSSEDQVDADYKPRNEKDEYNYKLYDPKTYIDAPISLQLVGRRYHDEMVVEPLEMIIQAVGLPFQQSP
ncbi:hypothetical protein LTR37_015332 [Vermiconidia calcicola]|uniref:Uncharacterized protein n=1 Tax=Vermiconidia calcicola TaxID=1690605 RepID=A0ACC3MR12_9PEZI|nr:hypothetical protein LTR37_015332 [Vermiconidia calcicola]